MEPGSYYCVSGKVNSSDKFYLVIESVRPDVDHAGLTLRMSQGRLRLLTAIPVGGLLHERGRELKPNHEVVPTFLSAMRNIRKKGFIVKPCIRIEKVTTPKVISRICWR